MMNAIIQNKELALLEIARYNAAISKALKIRSTVRPVVNTVLDQQIKELREARDNLENLWSDVYDEE